MEKVSVCGVGIDSVNLETAVERALEVTGAPCWVVTPNAVMLDACRRDRATLQLLNSASLSLADGVGVTLCARRAGTPLPGRVAGIDFGEALLSRAAERHLRVFLLGGADGVAVAAAERLRARFPGLCICGCSWGYFDRSGEEDRTTVATIRACRPDILFVCFGFPLQEHWIASHLHLLGDVRVVAGVGGALDVWAGRVHRAPAPVSTVGLEWLWRMLLEPKRLRHLPALVRCCFAYPKN